MSSGRFDGRELARNNQVRLGQRSGMTPEDLTHHVPNAFGKLDRVGAL